MSKVFPLSPQIFSSSHDFPLQLPLLAEVRLCFPLSVLRLLGNMKGWGAKWRLHFGLPPQCQYLAAASDSSSRSGGGSRSFLQPFPDARGVGMWGGSRFG